MTTTQTPEVSPRVMVRLLGMSNEELQLGSDHEFYWMNDAKGQAKVSRFASLCRAEMTRRAAAQ